MSGQQRHLFFMSTKCAYCEAFLKALVETPFHREFKVVCVDARPGQPRPVLPPYVKSVPTIFIAGEQQPRTSLQEAMNWLAERRGAAGLRSVAPSLQQRAPAPAPAPGRPQMQSRQAQAPSGAPPPPVGGREATAIPSVPARTFAEPAAYSADMAGTEGYTLLEDFDTKRGLNAGQTDRIVGNMAGIADIGPSLYVPDNRIWTAASNMMAAANPAGMEVSTAQGGFGSKGQPVQRNAARRDAFDADLKRFQQSRESEFMPMRRVG